jgi:hypothetical protein
VAAAVAVPAVLVVDGLLGSAGPAATAWRTLVVAAVVGTAVYVVLIRVLRAPFPRYRRSG